MNEFYKEEFLRVMESWPNEMIINYIEDLKVRVKNTQDQINMLRQIIRKRARPNSDTGDRGGK